MVCDFNCYTIGILVSFNGMSKSNAHLQSLPAKALADLQELGRNLAIARTRRKQTLRDWAGEIGVAVRTLQRMEAGDPGVGMAVYLAALWQIDRTAALPGLAAPETDLGAVAVEVQAAQDRLATGGARNTPQRGRRKSVIRGGR